MSPTISIHSLGRSSAIALAAAVRAAVGMVGAGMNWKRRLSVVVAAVAITSAVLAGPVGASPMPPEFGSAVKCKYTVTQYTDGLWAEAKLRLIAVIPPVMYATENGNEVGWRFLVTRSTDSGPYLKVYKSALQKRVGSTTDSAPFGVMRARIALPVVAHPELVRYRVTLVMFHYNGDGSVNSRTTHLLSHHIHSFDGIKDNLGLDYCPGSPVNS